MATLTDLIAALFGPSPRYKRAELEAILAYGPEAIAPLVAVLEAVLAEADAIEADEWGHLYVLVLLAHLRAPQAHDVVVRFLRSPSDQVTSLFGDFATEHFSGVLAATANGRTDGLKALIEDRAANTYARTAAAEALAYQVVTHGADRHAVLDYLAGFLDPAWSDGDYFLTGLAMTMIDLGPVRHADALQRLHDQVEIEPFMIKPAELHPSRLEVFDVQALQAEVDRALPTDLHAWLGGWRFGQPPSASSSGAAERRLAASREQARKKTTRKQQRTARKKQRGKRR